MTSIARFRVGVKSRAAWEAGDVDTILKTDFRRRDGSSDLRPSIYEVTAPQAAIAHLVVRIHAEHMASFLDPPRRPTASLDVRGLEPRTPVATPGATRFEYANECHRELVLDDEAELRALVTALVAERSSRSRTIGADELLDFVADRLAADDAEWQAATAPGTKGHAWRRIAEARGKRAP